MKDEHDSQTPEIFPDREAGEKEKFKLLKKTLNNPFQRLHIEKIIKGGTKKTTVSIEVFSYRCLALKLGAIPHTREANKKIKEWITEKMKTDYSYDPQAPYAFSVWLKYIILMEIVDSDLKKRAFDVLSSPEIEI